MSEHLHLPCKCKMHNFVACIGTGGYTEVFSHCTHTVRKVMRDRSDPFQQRLFKREIDIFAQLGSHPRIVEFYGFDDHQNRYYRKYRNRDVYSLFMYVRLEQVSLPPLQTRWQWAIDVAEGLAYLHSKGIMHQDLSAHNILLDHTCQRAVICDFGHSHIPGGEVIRSEGTFGFTQFIIYDPPTVAQDRFALGCTAFFLISARVPHDAHLNPDNCLYSGNSLIVENVVRKKFQAHDFPLLPTEIPNSINQAILKCWKNECESTEDLAKAFEGQKAQIALVEKDPWNMYQLLRREKLLEIAKQTPLPLSDD